MSGRNPFESPRFSRRNFVRGMGVAMGTISTASLLGACSRAPTEPTPVSDFQKAVQAEVGKQLTAVADTNPSGVGIKPTVIFPTPVSEPVLRATAVAPDKSVKPQQVEKSLGPPVMDGNVRFRSISAPYQVDYLKNWTQEQFDFTGNMQSLLAPKYMVLLLGKKGDLFYDGTKKEESRPIVAVSAEPVEPYVTTADYAQNIVNAINNPNISKELRLQVTHRQDLDISAGVSVKEIAAQSEIIVLAKDRLAYETFVFVRGGRGWKVSFMAPISGNTYENIKEYLYILNSFQFIN